MPAPFLPTSQDKAEIQYYGVVMNHDWLTIYAIICPDLQGIYSTGKRDLLVTRTITVLLVRIVLITKHEGSYIPDLER